MKQKNLFRLVYAALFAALIFCGTYLFKLPTPIGYIHLGDGFIFIAAAVLPAPFAIAAAMIGAGLSDLLLGYASWVLPTVIIKCACAVCFTRKAGKALCLRNLVALALSLVFTVVGYYFFGSLIQGNFTASLVEMPLNALQSIGGACIFVFFGLIYDKNKALREIFTKRLD
jgi:uncharacterized repeat protein (TIGR04002 family)